MIVDLTKILTGEAPRPPRHNENSDELIKLRAELSEARATISFLRQEIAEVEQMFLEGDALP